MKRMLAMLAALCLMLTLALPALAEEDTQAFLDGVLGTRDYMEAYNQTHIGQIALSKQDGAFLTAVEEIAAAGLPAGEAYAQLTALLTE